jgi:hypothetical protein
MPRATEVAIVLFLIGDVGDRCWDGEVEWWRDRWWWKEMVVKRDGSEGIVKRWVSLNRNWEKRLKEGGPMKEKGTEARREARSWKRSEKRSQVDFGLTWEVYQRSLRATTYPQTSLTWSNLVRISHSSLFKTALGRQPLSELLFSLCTQVTSLFFTV